jgi:hypothetical protein
MVKRCLTSTDDDIKSWIVTVSREARLQQTAGFNSFYNSRLILFSPHPPLPLASPPPPPVPLMPNTPPDNDQFGEKEADIEEEEEGEGEEEEEAFVPFLLNSASKIAAIKGWAQASTYNEGPGV